MVSREYVTLNLLQINLSAFLMAIANNIYIEVITKSYIPGGCVNIVLFRCFL